MKLKKVVRKFSFIFVMLVILLTLFSVNKNINVKAEETNTKLEYNFDYTGTEQTFTVPVTGKYLVELWGAQGNNSSTKRAIGGLGSYTKGTIKLNKNQKLYVYVGEHREDRELSFNAGSIGGSSTDSTNGGSINGYGGGGATDIRLINGEWNDQTSLASRIMVSAGGGGATDYAYPANGGYGGALIGGSGINGKYPNNGSPNTLPTGGTQTNGGKTTIPASGSAVGKTGTFGMGGNGNTDYGSAGGGGYYGGAGGGSSLCSVDSGAGGSSYISGYLGCVAITSETDTTPKKGCSDGTNDITCSYHYSELLFKSTEMKAGNEEMPTHDGTSVMIGNTENGYAKITLVSSSNDNYLSSLMSNYGTLNPDFDPTIEEYALTLDKYTSEFELTGETSNENASVIGLGKYEINSGETKQINVTITSESGEIRIYTINAIRENFEDGEHSTKLSKLEIKGYEEELNPEFNPLTNKYTLEIPSTEVDLNVITETFDSEAKVTITGNKYTYNKNELIITVSEKNAEDTIYKIKYNKIQMNNEYNFDYTGDEQTFIVPITWKYKLETWGAQGGSYNETYHGGYGGYSTGQISLKKDDKIYINVGGAGVIASNCEKNGGYNGGGSATTLSPNDIGGTGGGATHISNVSGILSTLENKKDNILIVSGAGGGCILLFSI